MQKPSIIICGSKKTHFDLSNIVDQFDTIVRHNKSLPKQGYGCRDADVQVLNKHVYANYKDNLTIQELYEYYRPMNISMQHITEYHQYIYKLKPEHVRTYERNNHHVMEQIAITHKLALAEEILGMRERRFNNDPLHVRCGMGHMAQCVANGIKPWLIGYSLKLSDDNAHCYNNKQVTGAHDVQLEIRIIKELHQLGLVDASLCNINSDGICEHLVDFTQEAMDLYHDNIRGH